nr:ubiquitin domain-containing protein [Pandoravirus massiliensis]
MADGVGVTNTAWAHATTQEGNALPIAFVRKGQRHALAFVNSFDSTEFHMTVYGAARPLDAIVIHLNRDRDAQERWESAPLPQCCICIDRTADRFLGCACTAPCVCTECSAVIRKCPQCRQHVRGRADCERLLVEQETDDLPTDRDWLWRMRNRFPWVHDIILPYGESGGMQLFLRSVCGRGYTLCAARRWPITLVKNVVYYNTGVVPHEQRLMVSGGRQLEGDATLNDWGVGPEWTIHLVMRLRGD